MLALVAAALAAPRFDLELREAEIHATLRMLAEVGDLDLVVPDTVQGTVTVRLRDVEWDTALAAVLSMKGLVAVPTGPDTRVVRPR